VIYVRDPDFTLLNCDVMDGLRTLPDESVHCVVTSPPYWGLRDYGTGLWDGGDPDCDHRAPIQPQRDASGGVGGGRIYGTRGEQPSRNNVVQQYRDVCGKCGARRQDHQLGLEPTPDEYVARMVEVFREVRRVLCRDGTCWVNLGDSYAGSGPNTNANFNERYGRPVGQRKQESAKVNVRGDIPVGLKPKDLVGIPWRLAFALQQDGWYLRSAITWCKPNVMPESVTDRPTKATEMVFLLTKSARYYYDAEAIRTEHQRDGRAITQVVGRDGSFQHRDGERWPGNGANARDWWLIATQPFSGAHFAVFPEELVRRCILAGSPGDGTVLDPFLGSGTTAYVARQHGRRSIGIELNADYCDLAARRMQQQSLFA
jgi:DNA modification methylase